MGKWIILKYNRLIGGLTVNDKRGIYNDLTLVRWRLGQRKEE